MTNLTEAVARCTPGPDHLRKTVRAVDLRLILIALSEAEAERDKALTENADVAALRARAEKAEARLRESETASPDIHEYLHLRDQYSFSAKSFVEAQEDIAALRSRLAQAEKERDEARDNWEGAENELADRTRQRDVVQAEALSLRRALREAERDLLPLESLGSVALALATIRAALSTSHLAEEKPQVGTSE